MDSVHRGKRQAPFSKHQWSHTESCPHLIHHIGEKDISTWEEVRQALAGAPVWEMGGLVPGHQP